MTDPIRTPDDEKPIPVLYPPFLPGRVYHAATYRGHSSGAIDMNRRSPTGAWMQDLGDPVLAAQDGKVVRVDKPSGTVELDHGDGLRTRYVHMRNITATVGQKVERGDQIGEVGNKAGGTASSFGPHLHFQVLRNGKPRQVEFEGQPVRTSVAGSDTKPVGWSPPEPVAVVGPPPKATWKGAFEQSQKRLERADERIAAKDGRIALLTEEAKLAKAAADGLSTELIEARRLLNDCTNATPPDCSGCIAERDAAIADRDRALASLGDETDRAVAAEEVVRRVRELVTL